MLLDRRQANVWIKVGVLLIEILENFNEIGLKLQQFLCHDNKINLNTSSTKWRPSCRGLNVLTQSVVTMAFRFNEIPIKIRLSKHSCLFLLCDTLHSDKTEYDKLHPVYCDKHTHTHTYNMVCMQSLIVDIQPHDMCTTILFETNF